MEIEKSKEVKNLTTVGDSTLTIQSIYQKIPPNNIILNRKITRILDLKETMEKFKVFNVPRNKKKKVDQQENRASNLEEGCIIIGDHSRWDLIP